MDDKIKINGPFFLNSDVIDLRLDILSSLLTRVGDDQRSLIDSLIKDLLDLRVSDASINYELSHSEDHLVIMENLILDEDIRLGIDYLIITRSGIILLEVKNLIGDILIKSDGSFIRCYKNSMGEVYKHELIKSPIMTLKYNADCLNKLINSSSSRVDIPIFSLVVMTSAKTIINKTYAREDIKRRIIKYDNLNERIKYIIKKHSNECNLSDDEMLELARMINSYNRLDEEDYIKLLGLRLANDNLPDLVLIDGMSERINKDDSLYEALRKYRINKASKLSYHSYIIFNNRELEDLVLKRPKTKEEHLKISGFGERKYELYGSDIINIIIENEKKLKEDNPFNNDIDNRLFKGVRELRYKLSKEEDVKPYMIFTNSQMEEIIRRKPRTLEELLSCEGVGRSRCDRYGESILNIINPTKI